MTWNIQTLLPAQREYYVSLSLDMYSYLEGIGGSLNTLYHYLPVLITNSRKSYNVGLTNLFLKTLLIKSPAKDIQSAYLVDFAQGNDLKAFETKENNQSLQLLQIQYI